MRTFWEKWKKVAEKIGNFQASVLFSILYFLLVTPLGVISSLFGDFLGTRGTPGWQEMDDLTSTQDKMKKQ